MKVRKLLRDHGISAVLEALDIAIEQYCEWKDGQISQESCEVAFKKLPGIIRVKKSEKEKPYLRELLYIRGIARNRLYNVDERECLTLLEDAHLSGLSIDALKDFTLKVHNWRSLRDGLIEFIDDSNESD